MRAFEPEQVVYEVAVGLRDRGHTVGVVGTTGSALPYEDMTLYLLKEDMDEEAAWKFYSKHLDGWDVVWDSSWQGWVYESAKLWDPERPVVHTFHAYPDVWSTLPPVRHPCFVGISEDHAEAVRHHFGVPVKRVYNGVDLEAYPFPDEDTIRARGDRYLWVGRYTPEKGPIEAIQLAKELRFPLTLIGDTVFPPDKAYIRRCFERADGLRIQAKPGMGRSQLIPYYQNAKALVNPIQWREPFGLVVIEAQLCGLPVVALDRGSMRELIKHGETGFVCRDLDEMRDVLDRDLVKEIDPAACRRWAEQFSTERMVENYERLFRQAVAEEPVLW